VHNLQVELDCLCELILLSVNNSFDLRLLCQHMLRLARTGFEEADAGHVSFDTWSTGTPRQTAVSFIEDLRIPLSSALLVELLSGIYYAMLVCYFFVYFLH